jgi:mono/diheme cytochrome c family protein
MMRERKIRHVIARLAVIGLGCGFVAACGGGGGGAPKPQTADAGKQLFSRNCGSCHVLADARAQGRLGPDLDQLRPGPDLVDAQVRRGGGAMPPFEGRLSDVEIAAIADYVANVAGKS